MPVLMNITPVGTNNMNWPITALGDLQAIEQSGKGASEAGLH